MGKHAVLLLLAVVAASAGQLHALSGANCTLFDEDGVVINALHKDATFACAQCSDVCAAVEGCSTFWYKSEGMSFSASQGESCESSGSKFLRNNVKTTTLVEGDPHFVGFDGSGFDFHGYDGAFFALLSDAQHAVNALFSRMGQELGNTYMSQIGLRFCDSVNLTITAQLGHGMHVEVNGRVISGERPQRLAFASGLVTVEFIPESEGQQEQVVVITPKYVAEITQLTAAEARHLDFKLGVAPDASVTAEELHGIVGQTYGWSLQEDKDVGGVIAGKDEDYEVSSLYATNFKYSKFAGGESCVMSA